MTGVPHLVSHPPSLMDHRPLRPFVRRAALIVGGVAVSLVICEVTLRLLGYRPLTVKSGGQRYAWMLPDAQLGWRNDRRGGAYHRLYHLPERVDDVTITLLAGGERSTARNSPPEDHRAQVLAVGCSLTFGWGVPDDASYPWRLQELLPEFHVRNLGVAGYGTYQSLLMLKQWLTGQGASSHPTYVVYGFMEYHPPRNVGAYSWLNLLTLLNEESVEVVKVPFCSLDPRGQLVQHPPEGLRRAPFSHRFALSRGLSEYVLNVEKLKRYLQADRVTELLLLDVQTLCRSQGATLLIAYLLGANEDARQWRVISQRDGFRYCDARPSPLQPAFFLEYERPHPSGLYYRHVAEKIAMCLQDSNILAQADSPASLR